MLTELKREAYEANMALSQHGLINLTFGNASALDRRKGIFAIKPSGVAYAALSPSDMVLVDLAGKKVEGDLKPSSDAPTHRRLYLGFKRIGGVVHTHSSHATAFAQTPTFSLEGVVSDAQQAVLPGATVTITNTATGLTRSVVTDTGELAERAAV